jgi:histone H3/H4
MDSHGSPDDESNASEGPQRIMADIPIANISQIMKNALPAHARITKETRELVRECVIEFIAFITSEGPPLQKRG